MFAFLQFIVLVALVIFFFIGLALVFYPNRISMWSADKFGGWTMNDWLGSKKRMRWYKWPDDPNQMPKVFIWWARFVGAGFVVMSAIGFYLIILS